jgi:hypothetical protein
MDLDKFEFLNNQPKLKVHDDHEVEMAKSQVYRAAKCAMSIHKMLSMLDNLEGWMQAKITLAADYLEAVSSNLEYDLVAASMMPSAQTSAPSPQDDVIVAAPMMEDDAKMAKISNLGRKIMDFAQAARPKTDEEIDLMNRLSAVGEKMTLIGTAFGPRGLTRDEKDLARQAQTMMRDHQSMQEASYDAGSMDAKTTKQRSLVRQLMDAGMNRMDAGEIAVILIRTGVYPKGKLGKFLADPFNSLQAQKDWRFLLNKKGVPMAQAEEIAAKLVTVDMEPKLPLFEDDDVKFLPGIPGEIVATSGNMVLALEIEDDGDVRKREYTIYTQDGEYVDNLNMPYARLPKAIHAFRERISAD